MRALPRTARDFRAPELALLEGELHRALVAGGDKRLVLDPTTGLNKYGCAALPSEALPLGSCTSSTISPLGLAAAQRTFTRLRAHRFDHDALWEQFHHEFLRVRVELAQHLGIDQLEGIHTVLTPSGTDAELIATTLALGKHPTLLNVVVAPSEVGSGTTMAAGGLHFDSHTPRGERRIYGDPVGQAEGLAAQVEVVEVGLRDAAGQLHDEAKLDEEVRAHVAAGLAAGQAVLVHMVAHSKTGAHVPSLELLPELVAMDPERVYILVDAAQGRLSRNGLGEMLRAGHMVLFTGSKFYGGPPFSGALFVPPRLHPDTVGVSELPAGSADYFALPELPTEWHAMREELPSAPNLGLLLRWRAALAEIDSYYVLAPRVRLRVLRAFERLVPKVLGRSPYVTLDSLEPPQSANARGRLLESKRSVFPFFLHPPDTPTDHFSQAQLRLVFRWLNADLRPLLPDDSASHSILAERVHIGQPVLLSSASGLAVLRVALGVPLMRTLAYDLSHGETLDDRIAWLEAGLRRLVLKLELIVDNFERLARRDAQMLACVPTEPPG